MADLTRNQLISRLDAGETQFNDMDLSGLDLSGIDISECNFHGCNFDNSDLTDVDGSYVDVSFCSFYGAVLDALFADQINLYGTNRGVAASAENALIIEDTTMKDMQIK